MLERSGEGEWIARAIIRGSKPGRPTDSDVDGEAESLVDWLERLDVPTGITSEHFDEYVSGLTASLSRVSSLSHQPATRFPSFRPLSCSESYQHKIDACRDVIRQGESYELTLTTSFVSPLPPDTDAFALYLRLRTFNPAYYSTYMSFPCLDMHVLSSSPERFLRIDGNKQVEMMPIKGTRARIKPGRCVCGPSRGCEGRFPHGKACIEEAILQDKRIGEALQADTKERAENLMVAQVSQCLNLAD